VLILADSIGGQTAIAGVIENFPGFDAINGFELISSIRKQVEKNKTVEIKEGESVEKITKLDDGFEAKTKSASYSSATILIAAGKRHRQLGLDNENELVGHGVSYCATCDGQFARGKTVAVIGGGNSAIEAAQILGKVADKIYLINNKDSFNGETTRIKQVEADKKVEILLKTETTALISNGQALSQIRIKNTEGNEKTIECQMIFVEIGWLPNAETFADIVDLNDAKEIKINPADNQTSQKGAYAAGDITDISAKQVIIACGEGAKAAIAINKELG
jgi:thioredoxin reductase